ncbi:MAG: hypothetical protein AAGN15_24360 [Cyanobacteria bacterium J06581_3]
MGENEAIAFGAFDKYRWAAEQFCFEDRTKFSVALASKVAICTEFDDLADEGQTKVTW